MRKACDEKIYRYAGFPLGAVREEDSIRISVSLPKEERCFLCLFDDKSKEISEIPMERFGNGIFSVSVKQDFFGYCFKDEKGFFADRYARRIVSRPVFGKNAGEAAGRFPNVPLAGCGRICAENRHVPYVFHRPAELVLYEVHIKNYTGSESSGVSAPGTFAGLSEKIPYIKRIGVTGVVLMPAYDFDENEIPGMQNVWGYTEKGTFYLAPKQSYACDSEDPEKEFLSLVEGFHRAGTDVYMEMYFPNGTPYALMREALVRYVSDFGVDGFRLNVGREATDFLCSDPYLSSCRFFADNVSDSVVLSDRERVIRFDHGFGNIMRRYLKGDEGMVSDVSSRFVRRDGMMGVRYITCHNGFTLHDLYSYDVKHNGENGENNRDGEDINFSWNCGREGYTTSGKVLSLRKKMMKNALVTLLLSGGIPMICEGDEFGNSQSGNNNPFCLDNDISHVDWSEEKRDEELLRTVKKLTALRKAHPMLASFRNLSETGNSGRRLPEISFHGESPWLVDRRPYNRLLGIYLSSEDDDDIYMIFNMHWEEHTFMIPAPSYEGFEIVFSTDRKTKFSGNGKNELVAAPRSVTVMIGKKDGKKDQRLYQ